MEWTCPHVVRADGLLVRHGGLVTVHVPREVLAAVEVRPRHTHSTWAIEGQHLHLPVAGTTAIDLVLARPLHVRAGRRSGEVTRISIAADDPDGGLRSLGALTSEAGDCYPSPK